MNFESALNSIPATDAAFNEYFWIEPVSRFGEIIDEIKKDAFYTGSQSTYGAAIGTLQNVNKILEQTQIFYHDNPEKKQVLEQIIQRMQALQQAKSSLDSSKIKSDVVKYNDNLESARVKHYGDYLVSVCDDYNSSNNNIIQVDYVPPNSIGALHDTKMTKTARGWVNGTFYPIESFNYDRIISEKRDKINYDRTFLDGVHLIKWFDLSNAEMVKELEKRGFQIQTIDRPAGTKG